MDGHCHMESETATLYSCCFVVVVVVVVLLLLHVNCLIFPQSCLYTFREEKNIIIT